MSKRWWLIAIAWNVTFGLVNLTLAVRALVVHRPAWLVALSTTALALNAVAAIWTTRNYRKERHGSDRRAEAGSQDPGTGDITFTFTNPGASATDVANALARYSLRSGAILNAGGVVGRPAIEEVESDMPILAHRIARLRFDGKAPFASLNEGVRFGVDADAQCSQRRRGRGGYVFLYDEPMPPPAHGPTPSLRCQCGFYALPSDVEPWGEGSDYVTLLVELSGTVIEHEKGYRAEHQRVIECQIPACPYCLRQADFVLADDAQMVTAACAAHVPPTMPPGEVAVAVDDLRGLVGVPVTRLGDSQ